MNGRVTDGIASTLLGAGTIACIVGFGIAPVLLTGMLALAVRRYL